MTTVARMCETACDPPAGAGQVHQRSRTIGCVFAAEAAMVRPRVAAIGASSGANAHPDGILSRLVFPTLSVLAKSHGRDSAFHMSPNNNRQPE